MLPTTNITTTLVGNTLGISSRDIGTLCTSDKINKWSLWKPVSYAKNVGITEDDLRSINFGMRPPMPTVDYVQAANDTWKYVKPVGGASSPFRIGDFRNYNHLEPSPIIGGKSFEFNITTQSQYTVSFMISSHFYEYFSDYVIQNYYMGIILVYGNEVYKKTATTTLGNGGSTIVLKNTDLPFTNGLRDYVCYILAFDKVVDFPDQLQLIEYCPLPFEKASDSITTFKVKQGTGITSDITGIGDEPRGPYMLIDNFVGPRPEEGALYYPAAATGSLYLKATVFNSNDYDITLYNDFSINAQPSMVDGSSSSSDISANLYDGTTLLSSVIIPAKSSKELRIGSEKLLNYKDGALFAQGQNLSIITTLSFKYKGNRDFTFSLSGLRVTNVR